MYNNKAKGATTTVGRGFKNKSKKGETYFTLYLSKAMLTKIVANERGDISLSAFAAKPFTNEKTGETVTPKYALRIVESKKPAGAAAKAVVEDHGSDLEI